MSELATRCDTASEHELSRFFGARTSVAQRRPSTQHVAGRSTRIFGVYSSTGWQNTSTSFTKWRSFTKLLSFLNKSADSSVFERGLPRRPRNLTPGGAAAVSLLSSPFRLKHLYPQSSFRTACQHPENLLVKEESQAN